MRKSDWTTRSADLFLYHKPTTRVPPPISLSVYCNRWRLPSTLASFDCGRSIEGDRTALQSPAHRSILSSMASSGVDERLNAAAAGDHDEAAAGAASPDADTEKEVRPAAKLLHIEMCRLFTAWRRKRPLFPLEVRSICSVVVCGRSKNTPCTWATSMSTPHWGARHMHASFLVGAGARGAIGILWISSVQRRKLIRATPRTAVVVG